MAVILGTAAVGGSAPNGTSKTISVTTAALDTRLLVAAGNDTGNGPPTSVTYNGVALTNCGIFNPIAGMNNSWWYLDTPPAGTFNCIASGWPSGTTGFGMIAIPLQGADLTRAPAMSTGSNGVSAAASCSVTGGAGAQDLQIAMMMARSTTCSSAGAPQAVVPSAPTMPILSINGLDSFSADTVTAGSAGTFGWTITSGTWVASGVTVYSPPGTPNPFYYKRNIHYFI